MQIYVFKAYTKTTYADIDGSSFDSVRDALNAADDCDCSGHEMVDDGVILDSDGEPVGYLEIFYEE